MARRATPPHPPAPPAAQVALFVLALAATVVVTILTIRYNLRNQQGAAEANVFSAVQQRFSEPAEFPPRTP